MRDQRKCEKDQSKRPAGKQRTSAVSDTEEVYNILRIHYCASTLTLHPTCPLTCTSRAERHSRRFSHGPGKHVNKILINLQLYQKQEESTF